MSNNLIYGIKNIRGMPELPPLMKMLPDLTSDEQDMYLKESSAFDINGKTVSDYKMPGWMLT